MISSGVISVTIGMLPAMKITEPYSPDRAREGQREAGQQRRAARSARSPREGLPAVRAQAGRGFFHLGVEVLQHRLHRAHHEGQADEVSATSTPSGVNATLMPSGSSHWPIQPFLAYSAVSAMPATAVGSAKGRSTSASTILLAGKG
jgi:hypothetical protein